MKIYEDGFEFNKLQALTLADECCTKKYYEETKASFRDFIISIPQNGKQKMHSDKRS